MNAKEARDLAENVNNVTFQGELRLLKDRIKTAAERGNLSITVENSISIPVTKKLKEEGFNVQFMNDSRDEGSTSISW